MERCKHNTNELLDGPTFGIVDVMWTVLLTWTLQHYTVPGGFAAAVCVVARVGIAGNVLHSGSEGHCWISNPYKRNVCRTWRKWADCHKHLSLFHRNVESPKEPFSRHAQRTLTLFFSTSTFSCANLLLFISFAFPLPVVLELSQATTAMDLLRSVCSSCLLSYRCCLIIESFGMTK